MSAADNNNADAIATGDGMGDALQRMRDLTLAGAANGSGTAAGKPPGAPAANVADPDEMPDHLEHMRDAVNRAKDPSDVTKPKDTEDGVSQDVLDRIIGRGPIDKPKPINNGSAKPPVDIVVQPVDDSTNHKQNGSTSEKSPVDKSNGLKPDNTNGVNGHESAGSDGQKGNDPVKPLPDNKTNGKQDGANKDNIGDDKRDTFKNGTRDHVSSFEEAARKFCRDVPIPKKTKTATVHAKHTSGAMFAVLTRPDKLWRAGYTITYGFVAGKLGGNEVQREKVRTTIGEWTWYADIVFQEVQTDADVRIAFDEALDAGSWSLVGTDCLKASAGEATMNLGWVDATNKVPTEEESATFLHEFGHVLGMLHEHQSPGGGGIPIANVEKAIEMYKAEDDWDKDMVRDQVINVYNLRDVSSFSEVDRSSIMHYPMPAILTGLDYDIPYNHYLSDQDKAYMCIMYPRPNMQSHPKASEWTFKNALDRAGINRDAPNVADEMYQAYLKGHNIDKTQVDAKQIRSIFTAWCQKAHNKRHDSNPIDDDSDATDDMLNDVPMHGSKHGSRGENNVMNVLPVPMCSNTDPEDDGNEEHRLRKGTVSADKPINAPAHAVTDKWKLFNLLIDPKGTDGDAAYRRTFTWALVNDEEDPLYTRASVTGKKPPPPATDLQLGLLRQAFATWARYASVKFDEVGYDTKKEPDIRVWFQDRHYRTDKPITKTDDLRSFSTTSKETSPSGASVLRHQICYRGISKDEKAANGEVSRELADTVTGRKRNIDFDNRTLLHEIGHVLGLSHEKDGVYGYCIFDMQPDNPQYQQRIKAIREETLATRFDTGSVMDSLRSSGHLDQLYAHAAGSSKDVRTQLRTSCTLSKYDVANITFLHPGVHLAGKYAEGLIERRARQLDLDDTTISFLKRHAADMKWSAFQNQYIRALEYRNIKDIDERLKIARQLQDYAKDVNNALHEIRVPARDAREGSMERNLKDENKGLLDRIYEALTKTMGPTGAQILTLQSPTRYLAKDEFQFELQGIYSNFIKPTPVVEAEFRLTDALYDAAAIVSAPNGRSLSRVYNQILNNLVPKYSDADRKVREERERIRSWLLTEVGPKDPYYQYEYGSTGAGKGDNPAIIRDLDKSLMTKNAFLRRMSRMEFANQLTQDYYSAQMSWELERDKMIKDAIDSKDPVQLNDVTRKLVHITQSQQGKLSMKYATSVVRGYTHTVREALGHLDVATPAEMLQDAKDAFRATAQASLYGASRVYPVLMSPVDWSAALDTGFAPEDLSENPEMLGLMIKTRTGALDNLKRQLAALQGSTEGDPKTLRGDVERKAKILQDAEANLYGKYADSTIGLAKIVIAIATDGASMAADDAVQDVGILEDIKAGVKNKGEIDAELEKSVKQLNLEGTAEDVVTQVKAVHTAQQALQAATSVWNSRKADLARAEATSTKVDQAYLENQIGALNAEINELTARLSIAYKARQQSVQLARDTKKALSVNDLATKKPVAVGGGSRWQQINIVHHQKYSDQNTEKSASATSEKWNVDFWIGGAGGSSEKSTASFLSTNKEGAIDIEISMKVTLVTVDRSSWFQPELFDNTKAYMKNNEKMTFSEYPAGKEAPEAVAKLFHNDARAADLSKSLLPAYPTGYILCKDVFIRCSNMNTSTTEKKTHLLEKAQSSGGFLCFSYNHASENSSDSSSAHFEMASDGMIVRIPGPQILAYVQQIVPLDNSEKYDAAQSLGKEFYLPPPAHPSMAVNKEKAKDADGNDEDLQPQHDLRAPGSDAHHGLKLNFELLDTNMSAPETKTKKGASKTESQEVANGAEMHDVKPAAGTTATPQKDTEKQAAVAASPDSGKAENKKQTVESAATSSSGSKTVNLSEHDLNAIMHMIKERFATS